jgi:fumarate hydratase subunit beta
MTEPRTVTLPMDAATARTLRAGEVVMLEGEVVMSAGLPAHRRLVEGARGLRELPRSIADGSLLHIASYNLEEEDALRILYVNPTTSTRFNALMPELIRSFRLTAVGGKGGLDAACVAAMREVGCVYFSFIGGGAPLLSGGIKEVVSVHWPDLISHFRLVTVKVERFGPVTVGIDAHGRSLYADLSDAARARLPAILAELDRARDAAS